MASRAELEQMIKDIEWKVEQLRKQFQVLDNQYKAWKQAYGIIENDTKIFREMLKNY